MAVLKNRPTVPARLRGAHPRRADGRFMSRASARGQITRITQQRAHHDRSVKAAATRKAHAAARQAEPRQEPIRRPERPDDREVFEPPTEAEDIYDDLDDWIDHQEDFEDEDREDIAGGFDTGKKKKK